MLPIKRCQCAFGFWEMTRPFFTLLEKAYAIFPRLQWLSLICAFALASDLPLRPGAMQGGDRRLKVAWTDALLVKSERKIVHSLVPGGKGGPAVGPQPLQPANVEPTAACATNVA